MVIVTERMRCRSCGSLELVSLWDLGMREIINFGDKEPMTAPLHLTKCAQCHLVQLKHTVDADYLFRKYYFKSGTNPAIVKHLKELVEEIQKRVTLKSDDTVVDIGANDGTLLTFYPESVRRIGFEPAKNIPHEYKGNTLIINNFFSAHSYWEQYVRAENAKVITALFMFYDLDNPNKFLKDIKKVLAPDGLFIIEMNYLPSMLENNAIDNVVHEHLCYYSVTTLETILTNNKLIIDDVEFYGINGGSFRVYVRHMDYWQNHTVWPLGVKGKEIEPMERNLDTLQPYLDFKARVLENAYKLHTFIPIEKVKGRTTAVYGASTRGLILLQLAGLNKDSILYVAERNPAKWGKLYNGIPVVAEEVMRLSPPDYLLILPYSFVDEFVKRESKFLEDGGQFIIPAPRPHLLGYGGVKTEL